MADVNAYGRQLGAEFLHTGMELCGLERDCCRGPLHLDSEQSYLLTNPIVQFARDAGTLSLLSAHVTASQFQSRELGRFAVVDVDAGSDVSGECAVGEKTGGAGIVDPVVFAVVTPQAVFHGEGLSFVEGFDVDCQASLQIVGVNSFRPSVAEFLVDGAPGKCEPAAVKVRAELVGARHPHHDRSAVAMVRKRSSLSRNTRSARRCSVMSRRV